MIKSEVIRRFGFCKQDFITSDGVNLITKLLKNSENIPGLWTSHSGGTHVDDIRIARARALNENDAATLENFLKILRYAKEDFGPYEVCFRFDDMGQNATGGLWDSFLMAGISTGRRNYFLRFSPNRGSDKFEDCEMQLKYKVYPHLEIYNESMAREYGDFNIIPAHISDEIIDELAGPKKVRREQSASLPHYGLLFPR
jgi:hypothetical protein